MSTTSNSPTPVDVSVPVDVVLVTSKRDPVLAIPLMKKSPPMFGLPSMVVPLSLNSVSIS
jgi:hypothetical protein